MCRILDHESIVTIAGLTCKENKFISAYTYVLKAFDKIYGKPGYSLLDSYMVDTFTTESRFHCHS